MALGPLRGGPAPGPEGLVVAGMPRPDVVLAGVLFLIGIGSTFTIAGVRYVLLGVGAALLVAAIVLITFLPSAPG